VTNLLMRVGDYATAGSTNISVVDSDSFWIDGYFEETKMARIHVGDVAEAKLMGYPTPVQGRVETITRGIATGNASPSTQGLPNVDPVYTWVRLAQRVPVRIKIEQLPEDIPLVAGMTATVIVRDGKDSRWSDISSSWSALVGGVSDLFRGTQDIQKSLAGSMAPPR
jgi:multidrug resistance efflux pump